MQRTVQHVRCFIAVSSASRFSRRAGRNLCRGVPCDSVLMALRGWGSNGTIAHGLLRLSHATATTPTSILRQFAPRASDIASRARAGSHTGAGNYSVASWPPTSECTCRWRCGYNTKAGDREGKRGAAENGDGPEDRDRQNQPGHPVSVSRAPKPTRLSSWPIKSDLGTWRKLIKTMQSANSPVQEYEANHRNRGGLLPASAGAAAGRWGRALLLALAILPTGRSQSSGSNGGSSGNAGQSSARGPFSARQGITSMSGEEDFDPIMAERRIRALNTERQKLMVADTNKLFRLAKELNQEIALTAKYWLMDAGSTSQDPQKLRNWHFTV